MNVAIFGGAGAIGAVVVPELLARGHGVRVVGRDAARLAAAFPQPGVEHVAADLADPLAARRAATGVDAIVYAVGVPYDRFELHPQLMRITLDAAGNTGVRELLLIGTVYPYGVPQTAKVDERHPYAAHTTRGRYRKEQLEMLLRAHDPHGLRTVALILPDFYGPGAEHSFAKSVVEGAARGTRAMLVGPRDIPHEFVYTPDVAPVVVDLLERPDAFGTTYHLGGAGTITTREFVRIAYASVGRAPNATWANKLLLQLVGVVNPLMCGVAEMYYLWTTPVVLDDAKLRALLPQVRKTPYEEGIRSTVAASVAERVPL
jgi:nucleoside-diphosphate-sugar epimerase